MGRTDHSHVQNLNVAIVAAMGDEAYERLERACGDLDAPFALVDLDALESNAADMERRAAGKPIRLASKSVRCRPLQTRVLARPGFAGTLSFTLPEALWLAGHGYDDLVVAYPTADRAALRELATGNARERIAIMVDSPAELDLVDAAAGAPERRGEVRVCLDVDAGWAPLGGRVRVGAKRSPIRTPAAAAALAREIAAGSGLYAPTLFDAYRAFRPRPAALFALPVVRKPASSIATALGGGYLASGTGDRARLPSPYLPAGLRLDRQEGAGEVQTPLLGPAARGLSVGDRVYFRHAKAGELCERFLTLHLLAGDRIVDQVPTYRGEGRCFL